MSSRTRAADDFAAIRARLTELRVDRQMNDAELAVAAGCRCSWLLGDGGLIPRPTPDCPLHAAVAVPPARQKPVPEPAWSFASYTKQSPVAPLSLSQRLP